VNTDPVVPYYVIAGDQGFVWSGADSPRTGPLVIAPGNRYDIVINFADLPNMASGPWRVIMTNQGGDEPFRGDIVGTVAYPRMQSIMAFDSTYTNSPIASNGDPSFLRCVHGKGRSMVGFPTKTRRLALFEGADEHGRLQPLLGTLDDAKDEYGNTILWPNDPAYVKAGLAGQPMSGTMPWHAPETEIINKDTIEEWEIWNLTGDAHPVHLHLVHFQVVGRFNVPAVTLVDQPVVQHNGMIGQGFKVQNPGSLSRGSLASVGGEYVETGPMDVVTALPGQITVIRAKFDKPGRYAWHCHILSHEDHEMMRVFEVK